jgi:CDP-glycerol glycerophosphotransferase (TagB/SpsB family)
MFDKPVINIAYDPPGKDISPKSYPLIYSFDHYKPLTDSGAIDIAWQEAQMKDFIHNAIAHPEVRREERKQLISKFFGTYLDGNSWKRIADKLLEWAS